MTQRQREQRALLPNQKVRSLRLYATDEEYDRIMAIPPSQRTQYLLAALDYGLRRPTTSGKKR